MKPMVLDVVLFSKEVAKLQLFLIIKANFMIYSCLLYTNKILLSNTEFHLEIFSFSIPYSCLFQFKMIILCFGFTKGTTRGVSKVCQRI